MDVLKKMSVREQGPKERVTNLKGVCLRYNREETQEEASRCVNCGNTKYTQGCPAAINIPKFIAEVKEGKPKDTANTIAESNALPAVCGHAYPQESQRGGKCIRGIRSESISIGKLERFVANRSRKNGFIPTKPEKTNGIKVVVTGSGPTELICAGDLTRMGYEVTIFEALHEPGGVLTYGIPEFRLPKSGIVRPEIDDVRRLGVEIETNVIIGKPVTIDELMDEGGYKAVFVGSGAGLPKFMGIPGENANDVFSANEYLTRSSLVKTFHDNYDTPVYLGKKVAVVSGGNAAMDAARTALRLGAEVYIVYGRSEAELSAHVGEVHHVEEEGIIFGLLANPVEILTDDSGWIKGVVMRKIELGEPDASGRRRPVEVTGSDYTIDVDAVTISLGTSPDPLIFSTTEGLETNKWKCIVADESNGKTTKEDVYTGGDTVTDAATVTLAMEAGRAGARGVDEYLNGSK